MFWSKKEKEKPKRNSIEMIVDTFGELLYSNGEIVRIEIPQARYYFTERLIGISFGNNEKFEIKNYFKYGWKIVGINPTIYPYFLEQAVIMLENKEEILRQGRPQIERLKKSEEERKNLREKLENRLHELDK